MTRGTLGASGHIGCLRCAWVVGLRTRQNLCDMRDETKQVRSKVMKQYTVKHTVAVVGLVAFLLSVMWTIMPQTIHAFS